MNLTSPRRQVYEANYGVYRAGFVTMRSGNASGLDETRCLVVIKPSGVDYEELTPEMLVVTDLEGRKVQTGKRGDELNPSADLPCHLYLYRHCADIGGLVHTHSNYATRFALLERSLSVYLSVIADEFGAKISCIPYTDNVGGTYRTSNRAKPELIQSVAIHPFIVRRYGIYPPFYSAI